MLKNSPPFVCNGDIVSGSEEIPASFLNTHFTSGGGFSFTIPQPSWQTTVVQAYLNAQSAKVPPAHYFNSSGMLLLLLLRMFLS